MVRSGPVSPTFADTIFSCGHVVKIQLRFAFRTIANAFPKGSKPFSERTFGCFRSQSYTTPFREPLCDSACGRSKPVQLFDFSREMKYDAKHFICGRAAARLKDTWARSSGWNSQPVTLFLQIPSLTPQVVSSLDNILTAFYREIPRRSKHPELSKNRSSLLRI